LSNDLLTAVAWSDKSDFSSIQLLRMRRHILFAFSKKTDLWRSQHTIYEFSADIYHFSGTGRGIGRVYVGVFVTEQ